MRIFISLLVFLLISFQINASTLDIDDKEKITNHFNAYVDNGNLPNLSILIKKNNKEIYRHAYGYADIDQQINVDQKTVYRIYSMTKPVTGVAIMQLIENGQLRPVSYTHLTLPTIYSV